MNSKELRYAFNCLIGHAESAKCEDLHHETRQFHGGDEMCPVEYKLHKQAHILREYMKEQGI